MTKARSSESKTLAAKAGHKGPLNEVTNDLLIYHLQMKGEAPDAMALPKMWRGLNRSTFQGLRL